MTRALRTSSKFDRKYVKFVRNNPRLQQSIEAALQLLEEDSTHPKLGVHALKGSLAGVVSCSCGYDCRILFQIRSDEATNEEYILLVDIGSHDDVY